MQYEADKGGDGGEGEDGEGGGGGGEGSDEEDGGPHRAATPNAIRLEGLNAPENLDEVVDPIDGITNREFARLRPFENPEAVDENEIAVIGFWRLNKNQVFRCYRFFLVPKPMKREIKETAETYLQQVLYTGNRPSPDRPGEIFFFYERSTGDPD